MGKTIWHILGVTLCIVLFITGCSNSSSKSNADNSETQEYNDYSSGYTYENEESDENDNDGYSNSIDDGTYSATVDYYNPETGFSNTYTLDVEVEDGEVVQIDFPNDGYLDEDHIEPAELDESGHCTVDGEDGKTYEIQLDGY